ncbi:neutral/alkaline non-lysosomal ceramidase N-terminal domain-containing protein [Roseitranquillus sediminis]|uniref:neutral/alkaline non-lysosomal ceramidase N-terminal domain-containing protein n=1 Tax=Roseitranquillus sediminis TaxID=2809051 RepID=UPI001D0CBE62|nr:neutral/alkaline non-lysosomal ceramidase N-terminal domain-containing protein [Roseitranquillus sediminis]MBM9595444.1 hypothetical protein [Roseitranquillus sediminis]
MSKLVAGAMEVEITPTPELLGRGLCLAGFAARTEPATGVHDPLAARAVVVEDTAIVVVDVIGLHEETSARIRARCALPDANVVVTSTHTHGAPASVQGRLGAEPEAEFLRSIEDACVAALDGACAARQPVTLTVGQGVDPGVARNRRHRGGDVDGAVPILRLRSDDGTVVAVIVAYACHPVVLGPDNRRITADYPHYVRERVRAAHPEAVALFLTGCAGDANTGHSAQDSLSLRATDARSFRAAEKAGVAIAEAALAASERPAEGPTEALDALVTLDLARREADLPNLARKWRAEAETADEVRRVVLEHWIRWAETYADTPPGSWTARVSALRWAGVPIVALPGEIFAQTGLSIRAACGDTAAFVLGYADSFPGYIPPADEFSFGGYEVEEAHRFIGMPAAFARGSAERLAATALDLLSSGGAVASKETAG